MRRKISTSHRTSSASAPRRSRFRWIILHASASPVDTSSRRRVTPNSPRLSSAPNFWPSTSTLFLLVASPDAATSSSASSLLAASARRWNCKALDADVHDHTLFTSREACPDQASADLDVCRRRAAGYGGAGASQSKCHAVLNQAAARHPVGRRRRAVRIELRPRGRGGTPTAACYLADAARLPVGRRRLLARYRRPRPLC
jgi:hypothetical protein